MKRIGLITIIFVFAFHVHAQNSQTNNVQADDIFYHTVERGQNVYAISRMYNVSVDDIYRLNPGSEQMIKAGQQLRIPQRTTAPARQNVPNRSGDEDDYIYHTIQPGESLYGVSRRYGISGESIIEANPGLSTLTFSFNKIIRIPKEEKKKPPVAEVVERSGEREIYYKVPVRETIFNICKVFKTTERELLRLNPELSGGLRAGMTIRIPLRINEEDIPKEPEPDPRTVNAMLNVRTEKKLVNAPKIALLLPFYANNPQAEHGKRIVEYYEGMVLAADTLRKQGHSMELFVHDIDTSLAKTKKILQDNSEELKKANLIIGGYTNEQIRLIADFAKQNKIKYVIPFTSGIEEVLNNAYVFQVNTPQPYQFANAAYAGANLFWKHNIIFLDTKDTLDQIDFIKEFKNELKDRNIAYKEAVYDAENFVTDIQAILSTTKPNMIMPVSRSLDALTKTKAVLRTIAETKPEYDITLYGYPSWHTSDYTKNCLDDFHALNTYIYTPYYVENVHPDTKKFNDIFKSWYNKSPMQQIFPKYSMLGYDTGMYFFSALRQFGVNFEDRLSELNYKGLQTAFNFERVNNWGGFLNSNIFIVHYTKDYTITRTNFR